MKRCKALIAAILTCVSIAAGCSFGEPSDLPTAPGLNGPRTPVLTDGTSNTHLWGWFDVYVDIGNGEVITALNRSAMFTANVTQFLNGPGNFMTFAINAIIPGSDYIDVDIDVHLTHPFPGLEQYNGYDVRGVFMGNGSNVLGYNSDVRYPVLGVDQFMMGDPEQPAYPVGAPDGYTRWFNRSEFGNPSMALFGYTQGKLASPGFDGDATLCPYKYFADGLVVEVDLWDWLMNNPDGYGVFRAGSTNRRNYYLRFPDTTDVYYGYAVIANWEGDLPQHHPSNAPEAVACRVHDSSNVYYIDETVNGGSLNLDIDIWNWSAGQMENQSIYIESTVLSGTYALDSVEMTPTGGGENWSSYTVEIDADNVTGTEANEYWVIVESGDMDYSNEFGVLNDAWEDPLVAYFRHDLDVSGEIGGPVCDVIQDVGNPTMPYTGFAIEFGFDATGSYNPGGGNLVFSWDFDDDDVFGDPFDSGTDDFPFKLFDFTNQTQVTLRVTNDLMESSECSIDVDIVAHPSKNIPLRDDAVPWDLAIDENSGRILIVYDDVTVWQYLLEDYYQNPDPDDFYYDTQWYLLDPWPSHQFHVDKAFIDTFDNNYFVINFAWNPQYWVDRAWYDVVDDDGNLVIRHSPSANWPWSYGSHEMMAFGNTGPYSNDAMMIWGTSVPGSFNYASASSGSSNWVNTRYYSNWYTSGPMYGYNYIMSVWTRGAEVDLDNQHFWTVERSDFYASRWRFGPTGFNQNGIVYDNAHFGAGAQTDNDNGFNNPRDLTRDASNNYMVLDRLLDDTSRIKGYDVSQMPVTSLGGMDLDDEIVPPAIKFDCGDFSDPLYGNYLAIIHGDDVDGYYLSIYFPDELPW